MTSAMQSCKLYRSAKDEYLSPDELAHVDLQKAQDEYDALKADNELLEEELECFRRYLKRQQDQQMGARDMGDGGDEYANYGLDSYVDGGVGGGGGGVGGGGANKREGKLKANAKGRHQSSMQKDILLSLEDKQQIANSEMDHLKKEREKEDKDMDRALEMIRACNEEAEVRIAETRKDSFDFNREIGETNVSAEKLLKYFEEKLKERERHTEKLRGKHAALKSQISKHEHQLKQREDMGEVLAPIDFDQLKIENQQFLERIEQKNKELVKLKLTTGNTVQTMNTLTEKLNRYTQEQAILKKEIGLKQGHLETLQKSIQQVIQEKEAAERKFNALRLQHEAVKVPKVEDYIQQKAEVRVSYLVGVGVVATPFHPVFLLPSRTPPPHSFTNWKRRPETGHARWKSQRARSR